MYNMIIDDTKIKDSMLEFLDAYMAHLYMDDSDKRLFVNSIYVTGRDVSERICLDVENNFSLLKVELMSYIICVSFASKQQYEYIENSLMDSISLFMKEKESVYTSRENVGKFINDLEIDNKDVIDIIEFLYGIWIRRNLDFVEQCESSGIKLKKSSEYYKAKMSRLMEYEG